MAKRTTGKTEVAPAVEVPAVESEAVEVVAGEAVEPEAAPVTVSVPKSMADLGFTPEDVLALSERGILAAIERKLSGADVAKEVPAVAEPDQDLSAARDGDGEMESEIAALKDQIRALQAKVERVPDAIDDLAVRSGHAAVFGKERWIAPDSPEQANRARLRETVDTLRAGYAARGKAVPPDAELVDRALRLEFADELSAQRTAPIAKRETQMLSRPVPRQDKPIPHGRERALATLTEKFREIASRG